LPSLLARARSSFTAPALSTATTALTSTSSSLRDLTERAFTMGRG
jgi:hypothetical protein